MAALASPLWRGTRLRLRAAPRVARRAPAPAVARQSGGGGGGGSPTRLVRVLGTLPQRVELYFKRGRARKELWKGISLLSGYYVANTISLSFGALAINDVVAAGVCAAFYEWVSRLYASTMPNPPLYVIFLNWFKWGFAYALIEDAFKLGT